MADYGIKVTEAGYDVASATDLQMILKSDYTLLKVAFSGSVSTTGSVEISHNLGYRPQFLAYFNYSTEMNICNGVFHSSYYNYNGIARVDTSKLYVNTIGSGNVHYYIFYEQM
jgi:hypothetical protein